MLKSKSQTLKASILNEVLPQNLLALQNDDGKRRRVLVKSISDLEIYCVYIENLSERYINYYGHKKAIGELLGVSTNRIGEWQRIWIAATVQYAEYENIKRIMENKENSLIILLQNLRTCGWQQARMTSSIHSTSKSPTEITKPIQRKKLENNISDGEKSIADPTGVLDFAASRLQVTRNYDSITAIMSELSEPSMKKRYISMAEESEHFSNFEHLSPFDYYF